MLLATLKWLKKKVKRVFYNECLSYNYNQQSVRQQWLNSSIFSVLRTMILQPVSAGELEI